MRFACSVLLAFLATGLVATAAWAETIRLRSGRTLDVESLRILKDRLNVTVRSDGAAARVELPFDRIEPTDLLRVLDRAALASDGEARLAAARYAFRVGLHEDAALRFIDAARVDPSLASQRDAGLAQIRRHEAQEAMVDLERRIRSGKDLRTASLLAGAILDSPFTDDLSAAEQRRVAALGALARKLVKRDTERELLAAAKLAAEDKQPADAAPGDPAAVDADQVAEPVDDPAVQAKDDVLAPLRANLAKAEHARELAANPELTAADAARHLEVAARELLEGRRRGRALDPDALGPVGDAELGDELTELALDLRAFLVTTYLDLADLYRIEQRFEEARARIRAVLILDPGNEEAWSQRRLIEDDIRGYYEEPLESREPGRYTLRSAFSFGYWSPSPFYGWCRPCAGAVPYGRGGSWFSYRSGRGYGARAARAVPYRRATGTRR